MADELNETQEQAEPQPSFDYTDPKTGATIKLPAMVEGQDLKQLMDRASASARISTESKLKTKYRELEEMVRDKDSNYQALQEKLEQIEDEKLTADDRAKKQYSREVEKAQKEAATLAARADQNFNLFQETKISNDLYGAFAGYELSNIEQAMLILRSQGQAALVEVDGKYSTQLKMMIDGELVELSPKDAVAKWVALPENAHFLKNNLRPGGGTSSKGGSLNSDGQLVYKRSQLHDPAIRKEFNDKLSKGETPEIVDG